MGRAEQVDTTAQEKLFGLSLEQAVEEARAILTGAVERWAPVKTYALFSGGNDSTTMLHAVKDAIEFDGAVHINTGIGIENTRRFVRETCAGWGIPLLEEITPPEVYRTAVLKRGFPSPPQHTVMYHRLKKMALEKVVTRSRTARTKEKVMFITGVRAYESVRRMGYFTVPTEVKPWMPNVVWVNPMLYFDGNLMLAYRKAHPDVPRNPVADFLHMSGECLCGAFAKEHELDEIETWFPATAALIHGLEAEVEASLKAQCVRPDGSFNAAQWKRDEPRCRWGWGRDRPASRVAPGPLCNSCVLPGFEEED